MSALGGEAQERAIAEATAKARRRHNLQQVHRRLQDARINVKSLRHLEALPDEVQNDLRSLVLRIEASEWRAEQAVLAVDREAKP